MRRSVPALLALVALAPLAGAASVSQTLEDPPGDARPNLAELDLVRVDATLDDERITADVKLVGAVNPSGVDYRCVVDINPTLVAHPRYELAFGEHHFQSGFHLGDSSQYPASTEGASWSEQGIHFAAKRGETNVVTVWDLSCSTARANPDGSRSGDSVDKNSVPVDAAPKGDGKSPGAGAALVVLAFLGALAIAARRAPKP